MVSRELDPAATSHRVNLLLVEDDEADRLWLRRCLLEAGLSANVHEASSAAEAMKRISINSYDCVFIDFYLPDVNGLALIEEARRVREHLSIVMLTGRGDEDLAVELMKAGVADYIPKSSITPERIASALRHAVALAEAAAARRFAEAELRDRERMFHTLAEAIPQLAWMADADANRTWFNQRWFDYTGTKLEEVEGWGWQKVHDPAEIDHILETIRHSLATGQPWERNVQLRGKDGSYRWFLTRMVPFRAEHGEIIGWVGTNTDITEQLEIEHALRNSEGQLRVAAAKAKAAADARSRFFAATSHDLRQPLQSIIGTYELLERHIPPEARATLHRGQRASERLARAFEKLVEAARLDTGVMTPRRSTFPLEPLFQEMLEIYREPAEQKGLRLSIPHCDERVNSDPEMLRSILQNLVGNAIKYTNTGGVSVTCVRLDAVVTIEVSDTGIGIPEDKLETIFQEYERINPGSAEGLGLGLAIVARQIEMLGHRISVESQLGIGSTFRLDIPAHRSGTRNQRQDRSISSSLTEQLDRPLTGAQSGGRLGCDAIKQSEGA